MVQRCVDPKSTCFSNGGAFLSKCTLGMIPVDARYTHEFCSVCEGKPKRRRLIDVPPGRAITEQGVVELAAVRADKAKKGKAKEPMAKKKVKQAKKKAPTAPALPRSRSKAKEKNGSKSSLVVGDKIYLLKLRYFPFVLLKIPGKVAMARSNQFKVMAHQFFLVFSSSDCVG